MQCIILVGGRGERLRPLTDSLPKPMLPLGDKPILWHQLMLLKKHKITDIVICGHYLFDSIKEYFGSGEEYGIKMRYVDEPQPMGTGGAVKNAHHLIKDDFVLLNGDTVTNLDITSLVNFHKDKGGIATLVLRKTDHPKDSDIVQINNAGRVVRFFFKHEQQKEGDLGNTGLFVFSEKILERIKKIPCTLEHDVIAPLVGVEPVYGYVSSDYIKDMGAFVRYEKVRRDLKSGAFAL